MPGSVTNLNRARKERARAERRARADLNAAKFGRSKAERTLQAAQQEQGEKRLDGHRREGEGEGQP